jgi:hypothetical protein
MRTVSLLRSATVALSLMASMGAMTAAFASDAHADQQQQQQAASASNASPYDSPNFIVPPNNIY